MSQTEWIIPKAFDVTDYTHRWVGMDGFRLMFGCGFYRKPGITVDHDGTYPYYATVYLLRGRGAFTDHHGNVRPLTPGSVFQRWPDRYHRVEIDPGSDWLEFFWGYFMKPADGEQITLQTLRSLGVVEASQIVCHRPLTLMFLQKCRELFCDFRGAPENSLMRFPLRGAQLLQELLVGEEAAPLPATEAEQLVETARERIREHCATRLKLAELLADLPISYSRLRVLFQQQTGASIGRFQIQCRVERATVLLMEGKTLKVVADELGYSDVFAFSSQFKQVAGCPPSRFRKPA